MRRNLLEKLEIVKDDLWEQLENLPLRKKINLVNEISGYDGTLDYLMVYDNDEMFFETFYANKPLEAVRATYFGDYKYADDYVRINEFGNLESFNQFEFEEDFYDNIDVIIDWIIDNPDCIELDYYLDTKLLYDYLLD